MARPLNSPQLQNANRFENYRHIEPYSIFHNIKNTKEVEILRFSRKPETADDRKANNKSRNQILLEGSEA